MSSSSTPPTQPTEVKRWTIYNREYVEMSDGRQYTRKLDRKTGEPSEWTEIISQEGAASSSSTQTPEPKKLYLVLEAQAEDEPKHWSLFVTRGEGSGAKGQVWQVTGDATYMHYQHADDYLSFDSEAYYTSYALNMDLTRAHEDLIKEAVEKEAPPRARDRRSVTEHCQGWTIRVLRRLVRDGVVAKETVDWVESQLKEAIVH